MSKLGALSKGLAISAAAFASISFIHVLVDSHTENNRQENLDNIAHSGGTFSTKSAKNQDILVRKVPEANGCDVRLQKELDTGYTRIKVGNEYSGRNGFSKGYLLAVDMDGDYRFDYIELRDVKKDDRLEELASLSKLAEITRAVEKR